MTPREPDRYEAKALELVRRHWIDHTESTVKHVAAALRAEHEALRDVLTAAVSAIEAGAPFQKVLLHRLRSALASPAAAPAVETLDEEAEDAGPWGAGRGTFVAPPSEPVAPASSIGDLYDASSAWGLSDAPAAPAPPPPKMDEDGCCAVCGRGLEPCYACDTPTPSAAEKRIAELERALREARDWIAGEGSIVPERLVGRIDAALAGDGSAET